MADHDAQYQKAELEKLEAERVKLDLEAEEVKERLKPFWRRPRIFLQTLVGGFAVAALLAGWGIDYAADVIEMARSRSEQLALEKNELVEEMKAQAAQIDGLTAGVPKIIESVRQDFEARMAKAGIRLAEADAQEARFRKQIIKWKAKIAEIQQELDKPGTSQAEIVAQALNDLIKQLELDSERQVEEPAPEPEPAPPPSAEVPALTLRSRPGIYSNGEVFRMIRERRFNLPAEEIFGDFQPRQERRQQDGIDVVVDASTGLMWQQGGSDRTMTLDEANTYVHDLNRNRFAGFSDWRLPTVEELLSLVEPDRKNGILYISSAFSDQQRWIITSDKESVNRAWGVVFYEGKLYLPSLNFPYWVRAVRTNG